MRMPELKSLTRDHGLRNYSWMRKAELVAFLPFGLELFSALRGKARASNKTCVIPQFSGSDPQGLPRQALSMGNKILPLATFYLFQEIVDFGFFQGNCTCIM